MATCKDCIHYEPCFSGGVSMWNNIEQTKEDCCSHFKNKADFVEVVRCKDCERAKMYVFGCGNTEHLACVDTDDNGEIVFAQAVEPNHFCSYGTPKERGGEK